MPKSVHQQFAEMAIDALGRSTAVANLFGLDERVVSNWKQRGLPPDTYAEMAWLLLPTETRVALEPLMIQLRNVAPPAMWRQRMLLRKRVVRPPRRKNGKRR